MRKFRHLQRDLDPGVVDGDSLDERGEARGILFPPVAGKLLAARHERFDVGRPEGKGSLLGKRQRIIHQAGTFLRDDLLDFTCRDAQALRGGLALLQRLVDVVAVSSISLAGMGGNQRFPVLINNTSSQLTR